MFGFFDWNLIYVIYSKNISDEIREFLTSKPHLVHFDGSIMTRIEDSIHYNAIVTNKFDLYEKYIKNAAQPEHSVDSFKKLIAEFEISKIGKIGLLGYAHHKKFVVFEGNHRLAIIKYKGLFPKGLPTRIVNAKFTDYIIDTIKDKLIKTTEQKHYNGWDNKRTKYGYHSFLINNLSVQGQRNPLSRLIKIRKHVDFTDKNVLDLGCNTGGMLLHLPEISHGVGVDFDVKCIEAANTIKDFLHYNAKYKFMVGDLNTLQINSVCKEFKPDIIFLLSLGSWITMWQQLYMDSYEIADKIVFETNNDNEGMPQLDFFDKLGAKITLISDASDDDCTGNKGRKTYLIERMLTLKN